VRKALSHPARQIAINAGEDGSVIVGKILEKDQYAYGFGSQTGEYVNLIFKGIIDPTKVVRVAIQNASSVDALLITTEAMVLRAAAWAVWTSKSNRSELVQIRNARQRCRAFCFGPSYPRVTL
jgi:chaperonin GroEL (HSP60 family)